MAASWLDRLTGWIAPVWTLRRQRARAATILLREYEGASVGRRTYGWNRTAGDANAAGATELARLRETARDLVRNNPIASAALDLIADHAVGTGIVAKPLLRSRGARTDAMERWRRWAETPLCDAEGRHDFAGLQKLVMRTVAEAGECLIRRRWRRAEDNLPIPMQLQVLEPDYLDATRDTLPFVKGGPRIIGGIEFDGIGRRTAYYLWPEHPGSGFAPSAGRSARIDAADVLHVFQSGRPGQARGVTWFAPVMTRLKELDEYEDAALVKQKIAACLAVIVTDMDGATTPGVGGVNPTEPAWAMLSPGMIHKAPAGQAVSVVQPPLVNEHAAFVSTVLRTIAAGLGLTCEDLTGSYEGMPFSAARMSRLRHWDRVNDWRWRMLIPQFCDPAWVWAMQAASIVSAEAIPTVKWTCPPPPMIDPAQEGLAYQRNIRTGIQTLSDAIRERGEDPDEVFAEMATDTKTLDRLGLILDSDARSTTQGGQLQGAAAARTAPTPIAPSVPSPNGAGAAGATNGAHA